MSVPAISVAMSVYNGERFLAEAIESVLAQSFSDFEFLIVDDGSLDGTREIIEYYAARDLRIRLIAQENRGLIASLNRMLEEARAPLVARMDGDDVCHPERFMRQVAFLADNPDVGVLGTWSDHIDESGLPYPVNGPDQPLTESGFFAAIERGDCPLSHPAVIYRRDVVRSVNGYRPAFRHCEDFDLWLRLASVTRLTNIPERLVRYRHYPGQVSIRHATEQQIGAAIALMAYHERAAGRPDPTAGLARLPPIDQLDALFGRAGISRLTRSRVAAGLIYSPEGMRGDGFDLVMRHLRDGGSRQGMWRTVLRLVRFGRPIRAVRLAAMLALAPALHASPKAEQTSLTRHALGRPN